MARNCNIIFAEIFVLGYCNIIFVWYNYNAIEKEAGCFSAGKGIETMKKLFEIYETENEAKTVVRNLMADGISAYRQVTKVYVDDGYADETI